MSPYSEILTGLVVVTAALTILAEETNRRNLVFVFKPLTTVFILLLAVALGWNHANTYVVGIWFGLVFSLAGDIFLMLLGDQFIQGLVSFLIAHLFYIFAFSRSGSFHLSLVLVVLLLYGILIFLFLSPRLGKMKIPVAVYMVVILTMAWQAWARFDVLKTPAATEAFAGALFFVASDSLLAINRFRQKLPVARLWILGTYFVAQWLIAVSVH